MTSKDEILLVEDNKLGVSVYLTSKEKCTSHYGGYCFRLEGNEEQKAKIQNSIPLMRSLAVLAIRIILEEKYVENKN